MRRTVSQIIKNLRREYHALKQAFEANATQINLITRTTSFATKKNECYWDDPNAASYDYTGNERTIVTFDTTSGANTIAKLEISGDYVNLPEVRRMPYTGGARWVVSTAPEHFGSDWEATHYQFTVQSLVDGSLSAKMIWE